MDNIIMEEVEFETYISLKNEDVGSYENKVVINAECYFKQLGDGSFTVEEVFVNSIYSLDEDNYIPVSKLPSIELRKLQYKTSEFFKDTHYVKENDCEYT